MDVSKAKIKPQNQSSLVQRLQVELDSQKNLLSETQEKLVREKQKNKNLTNLLSKAEEELRSLSLKKVPTLDEISKNHYPCFKDDLLKKKYPKKNLRICIVTQDILGPIRNGGIGTAFYYAATFLQSCGHDVTIFYSLGNHCETGTIEEWIQYYRDKGINFVPASDPKIPSAQGPLGRSMLIARKVYEYLKESESEFDIVHVSEWRGNGFYALLAKKLGLAFKDTIFCIKTSSPSLWGTMGNNMLVNDPQALLRSYIERKSVEWGDIIISPSNHMLNWMEYHGYDLPKDRCYVQPNIMPITKNWVKNDNSKLGFLKKVKELVFFGRLEPRKGLQVFCKALNQLEKESRLACKVIFLGKFNPATFDAQEYIQSQAENWSFEWELITDYNALQAMSYLKENNRLAIVPSLLDNSPFTIYECLAERIPFICSDRGGTPELVHEQDRADVVVQPHPTKLANRLREVLKRGIKVARASFDFQDNLKVWDQWHLAIGHNPNLRLEQGQQKSNLESSLINVSEKPLVSVCLAHFNRPHELSQAIKSIKDQTYNNYEVVLVDDGSDQPEALSYLDSLEEDFASRGWRIIRQENLYLGAVRNTSVRHAKGEYVMFMDDDNCAKPHEIETFVAAAQHSGADILTCFADTFSGEEMPYKNNIKERLTPVGDCLSYGLLGNCYGDSNALVKRSFFHEIGGFSEDYGVGLDDQEFFSRAILCGARLFVIPEALYWYRISKVRLRNLHFDLNAGSWRVFRPYMSNLPWAVHDILRLVMGLFQNHEQTKNRVAIVKNLTKQIQENFEKIEVIIKD